MKYNYTKFIEKLDFELQQERSYGDRGTPNKYRYLPTDEAKRTISEVMLEFAMINPDHYLREQLVEVRDFSEMTTAGIPEIDSDIFYVDIDEQTVTLPERMDNVFAFWYNNSWRKMYDSSVFGKSWYSPSSKKFIMRNNSIEELTQIKFFCSVMPKFIKDNFEIETLSVELVATTTNIVTIVFTDTQMLSADTLDIGDTVSLSVDGDGVLAAKNGNIFAFLMDSTGSTAVQTLTFDTDLMLIDFPPQFIFMLILAIKFRAYGRAGKLLSQAQWTQYNELRERWQDYSGQIVHTAMLSAEGFGYGKR